MLSTFVDKFGKSKLTTAANTVIASHGPTTSFQQRREDGNGMFERESLEMLPATKNGLTEPSAAKRCWAALASITQVLVL